MLDSYTLQNACQQMLLLGYVLCALEENTFD